MSKLNEKEVKEICAIENLKAQLTKDIDGAINALTKVRMSERDWWHTIVEKYHLDKKKLHRVWIDGEILEERRRGRHERKIF